MKIYLLIFILIISTFSIAQKYEQGLVLIIKEKSKIDKISPIKNKKITIILNDSVQYILKTSEDGIVSIKTQSNIYSVLLSKKDCQEVRYNGVVVKENKPTIVTFLLTCNKYANRFSTKEKKKRK